jgi:hypothetical protein
MSSEQEITEFIRTTFRSVWALELLLMVADEPKRSWSPAELVAALRASDLIVGRAVGELAAAGMLVIDSDNLVRYAPASDHLDGRMAGAREYYARSPDKVRRIIISASSGGLTAFADAFRIRKD